MFLYAGGSAAFRSNFIRAHRADQPARREKRHRSFRFSRLHDEFVFTRTGDDNFAGILKPPDRGHDFLL